MRWIVGLALAWFGVRLLWLATHTSPLLPPDEVTHLARCLLFAETWGVPADGPETASVGVIGRRPFLYYWWMGRLLALEPFGLPPLAFLRVVNAGLALGTVWIGWRFVALLSDRPPVRVLFLVALTNLPMFTFLSASVSYDNLANLVAAGTCWALAAALATRSPRALAWLALLVLLAPLAKRTLLPFSALVVVAWLVAERRSLAAAFARLRPRSPAGLATAGLVLLLALVNVELYGGNWLRYGRLIPAADQVVSLEAARAYRIFTRDDTVERYRRGALPYGEALAILRGIDRPSDRAVAVALLKRARADRQGGAPPVVDRVSYAGRWLLLMGERVVGVMGHAELFKGAWGQLPFQLLCLGALALLLRLFRPYDAGGLVLPLLIVSVGYLLVLMQAVNYPRYHTTGAIQYAVQGRYAFPVLLPWLALLSRYGLALVPDRLAWPVVGALSALFVLGDGPWLWWRAPAAWWSGP